jgi:hypothetical protein
MLILSEPRLEHVAALALLLDQPDYLFPRIANMRREIEIRMDHDLGTVRFYDHLGLPLPISEIRKHEVWAMFNRLFLKMQQDNQPDYLNN